MTVPRLKGTGVDGMLGGAPPDPAHVETAGLANPYRIIAELMAIATVDPGTAYDADGQILPLHQMPDATRRALAAFEVESEFDPETQVLTSRTAKIKFWSKPDALTVLARTLGMLVDRTKHELGDDAAELLALAREARVRAQTPYTAPRPELPAGTGQPPT